MKPHKESPIGGAPGYTWGMRPHDTGPTRLTRPPDVGWGCESPRCRMGMRRPQIHDGRVRGPQIRYTRGWDTGPHDMNTGWEGGVAPITLDGRATRGSQTVRVPGKY